jgi:hypothetical protein
VDNHDNDDNDDGDGATDASSQLISGNSSLDDTLSTVNDHSPRSSAQLSVQKIDKKVDEDTHRYAGIRLKYAVQYHQMLVNKGIHVILKGRRGRDVEDKYLSLSSKDKMTLNNYVCSHDYSAAGEIVLEGTPTPKGLQLRFTSLRERQENKDIIYNLRMTRQRLVRQEVILSFISSRASSSVILSDMINREKKKQIQTNLQREKQFTPYRVPKWVLLVIAKTNFFTIFVNEEITAAIQNLKPESRAAGRGIDRNEKIESSSAADEAARSSRAQSKEVINVRKVTTSHDATTPNHVASQNARKSSSKEPDECIVEDNSMSTRLHGEADDGRLPRQGEESRRSSSSMVTLTHPTSPTKNGLASSQSDISTEIAPRDMSNDVAPSDSITASNVSEISPSADLRSCTRADPSLSKPSRQEPALSGSNADSLESLRIRQLAARREDIESFEKTLLHQLAETRELLNEVKQVY